MQMDRSMCRQRDEWVILWENRQTDRSGRQMDRWAVLRRSTNARIDRQTDHAGRQIDRQTDRQMDRQTDAWVNI